MHPRLRILTALVLLVPAIVGLTWSTTAAAEAAATPTPAPAESTQLVPSLLQSLSGSFDATLASRYLFQGIDYSDGRTVLQPNVVVTRGPIAAVVWANYQTNLGDVNEVDLSLKATHSVGRLTASPGYTSLFYPNRDWDPSQEVFVDLAVEAPLSPSLSVHHDFDAGDGTYATLALSQPLGASVSVASNVFYQHQYYGMTGFPSVELKVSTTFTYAGMTLTPSLSRFATTDNGDFSDDAGVPDGWLFSLGVVPKP